MQGSAAARLGTSILRWAPPAGDRPVETLGIEGERRNVGVAPRRTWPAG